MLKYSKRAVQALAGALLERDAIDGAEVIVAAESSGSAIDLRMCADRGEIVVHADMRPHGDARARAYLYAGDDGCDGPAVGRRWAGSASSSASGRRTSGSTPSSQTGATAPVSASVGRVLWRVARVQLEAGETSGSPSTHPCRPPAAGELI
jgi:hypothetical protein